MLRKILIDLLLSTKKSNKVKQNLYSTNYNKHALVSYNIYNFINKKSNHTNYNESHIITKIISEFGFNIDVVNLDNEMNINLKKYDLIFGFGVQFEKSFLINNKAKRIYYATGAHICHQNYAEIKRIKEFNNKYNTKLLPQRIVPWNWSMSTSMCDALIVIGNDWIKNTYIRYLGGDIPIYKFNVTALSNKSFKTITRDITYTKKNFLWFGSGGLVHKGLDLCIEYFANHSEYNLHICAPRENDFFEIFSRELELENIHYYGFVDVQSEEFINIISKCSFSILPSCSEAQVTSLLTCMNVGLIPLSTIYSAIDIEKFGLLIDSLDNQGISDVVHKSQLINNENLQKMSNKVKLYTKEKHSLESFEKNLKKIMKEIIINGSK